MNPRFPRLLFLPILLLSVGFCFAQKPNDDLAAFNMGKRDGPHVLLPKTVSGFSRPGPDFRLYYFTTDTTGTAETEDTGLGKKRQILFAYVGFAPAFPKGIPKSVKEKRAKINDRPARTFAWDKDGKQFRETLVDTGKSVMPGTVSEKVHFAYADLTPADAKIADAIIDTLKPTLAPLYETK